MLVSQTRRRNTRHVLVALVIRYPNAHCRSFLCRIDVEIFVTGGDLRLQANKNYVGLLDVLGGMKGEIQVKRRRIPFS